MTFSHSPRGNSILTGFAALSLISILGAAGCRAKNPMPIAGGEQGAIIESPVVVPPLQVKPGQKAADEAVKGEAIQVEIKADKAEYGRGDIINFTITSRNTSDRAQEVTYSSGRNFDITATREGEKEVAWRWSAGKMFTMIFRTVTIQPGESKTFTATWEQQDADGAVVPRGTYKIVGELATKPRFVSPPLTITLVD